MMFSQWRYIGSIGFFDWIFKRCTNIKLNVDVGNHLRLCNSLGKHISTLTRDRYAFFTPTNIGDKPKKIICDPL